MISKKSHNAINLISWISIAAISVTTAALVIILSAMNGITGIVAGMYNALEPDIRITPANNKYFELPPSQLAAIRHMSGVSLVTPAITDKALLKSDNRQSVVVVRGVRNDFRKICRLDSAITEGSAELRTGKNNFIVAGQGIASKVGLALNTMGAQVSLLSPGRGKKEAGLTNDVLNQLYFLPGGMFSLNQDLDNQQVFIDLSAAAELFDAGNLYTSLEIGCTEQQADQVAEQIKRLVGSDYVVKTRYQLNDTLFRSLETEKVATFFILSFVLIIATFSIIGALTMLIIEKRKDIKTLYALGADANMIRGIFMREGLIIAGTGAISGLLLGLVVCWLQITFHFVGFGDDGVLTYFPVELQFRDFVWILTVIMIIAFLSALYPVRVFTKSNQG